MKLKKILSDITALAPRQGTNILQTENYITNFLNTHNMPFKKDFFVATTPSSKASLLIDNKKIETKGCGFISGKITKKDILISSTTPSRFNLYNSNINFNPHTEAISRSNYYFAPALAIAKKDVPEILDAVKIKGTLEVTKIKTKVAHILVGNTQNPKTIIFAHYDAIDDGAMDNASGVTVLLGILMEDPSLLRENLFVFDPNEELSYDEPTYWGHGFRVFQKKYESLMKKSKRIIVVDCVGTGKTIVDTDKNSIYLAFPINTPEKYAKKIATLYSNLKTLQKVYHSTDDTPENLSEKYLYDAVATLKKLLI